jgi:hypothetical protein
MDYITQVNLLFVLSGVAYFFLYRLVFFKKLKWKMLHSIWIPLAVSLFFTVFGIILLSSPSVGGSFNDLAGIIVLIYFNIPSAVYLALFLIYHFVDKKALKTS